VDQYCVVLCGLHAGAPDETSAWQPVAAALKLDHAEFERRVVAALPRVVRRELDLATAERIAQVLQALQVDARVLPDDPQLVYIERAGASCGPLPQSSLVDFIEPGESFRHRGTTTWKSWPEPVDQAPAAAVEVDAVDDWSSPPVFSDEPIDPKAAPGTTNAIREVAADEPSNAADDPPELARATPPSAASDDVSDAAWDAVPSATDDEPHDALSAAPTAQQELTPAPYEEWEATAATADALESARRDDVIPDDLISNDAIDAVPPDTENDEPDGAIPPLGTPPIAQEEPIPSSPEDGAAIEPATDSAKPVRDGDLLDPAKDTTASASPDAAALSSSEAVETRPPARSSRGRFIVLLILIALAIWAYRQWMADTRTDGSPAAPAVVQPANTAEGKSGTSVPMVPAENATSATAPAAGVTPATSTATPADAASTPAPAASAAMPAPATSSGTAVAGRAR
jgi:hypothetical protein